jgi:hypothetical protein
MLLFFIMITLAETAFADVAENSEQRIKTPITSIIPYQPKVQGHISVRLFLLLQLMTPPLWIS